MDKLRKYIQECGGDIVYSDYDKVATLEDLEYNYRYIRFLLSTEAMFIKWLVDNDKIDKKKIDTRLVRYVESHYDEEGYWVENSYEDYELYECLLMLLAISDTPIEDLISYLK